MSTYHLPTAVLPLVDWTASYAVRRRLSAGPIRRRAGCGTLATRCARAAL